jgi:hypothetical protein
MRCVICRQDVDFAAGQTAVVLRHVAYGYDFVHAGSCEAAALSLIFPEPGYDCAAFAHDPERAHVLAIVGGAAPLDLQVVVQYRDGSRGVERIVRDLEWASEPGAAEFPRVAARAVELAA